MRIDLPAGDGWNKLNDVCRAALGITDAALQVQAYSGYQHALIESTQGLARLFSHKKKLAIVQSSEPAIASVGVAFSEDAYEIKQLKLDDANLAAELDPLMSELLFVLFAIDDPVTGRLHDLTRLEAALKDKRVFRVGVSHAAHLAGPVARPSPFEVRILSYRPDFAVIAAGERFRIVPALAPKLSWERWLSSDDARDEIAGHLLGDLDSRQKAVLAFESALPNGFKPYFKAGESRLFDRAVFYHPEIDGSALIDELSLARGLKIASPGKRSPLEASSPCRWNDMRMTDWLLARGESEEIVRGLTAIDSSLLDATLAKFLTDAANKILARQRGN